MKYLLLLTLLIGCGEVDNPSPRYSTHYYMFGDTVYAYTYDWETGKETKVGFHKDSMPGLVKLAEMYSVEYGKRTSSKTDSIQPIEHHWIVYDPTSGAISARHCPSDTIAPKSVKQRRSAKYTISNNDTWLDSVEAQLLRIDSALQFLWDTTWTRVYNKPLHLPDPGYKIPDTVYTPFKPKPDQPGKPVPLPHSSP